MLYTCPCGHTPEREQGKPEPTQCPECGAPIRTSGGEKDPAGEILTDSYIEAAYEVLAEEGAIWSGAR